MKDRAKKFLLMHYKMYYEYLEEYPQQRELHSMKKYKIQGALDIILELDILTLSEIDSIREQAKKEVG